MRKRIVSLVSVAALFAGTATVLQARTAGTPAPQAKPVPAKSAAKSADAPQYGSFGFDETGMDRSVAPGDDFYDYANGGWVKATPIPAEESSYGLFNVLADLSRERTRGLIEGASADPASKIGRAYAAYLDTAAIEARGIAPLKPWLDRIKGLSSMGGYAALVAEADRNGVGVPFGSGVRQDQKAPDTYIVGLGQGGLGLPDREYYLSADPKLASAKAAYQAHIGRMLALAGEGDVEARAKAIVDLETAIAKVHWTRIDNRNTDKTYNKMALSALTASAPGFDFATYLKGVGMNVDTLIVSQPTAITAEAAILGATPIAVLKDQLLYRSLNGYSDVLPAAFDRESFAFYGTVLSGTPEQRERWKRAVGFTEGALTDEVGKLYVAKYFPPETKAAADQLVKNVLAAMDKRVDTLDWMSPATKAKTHAKLAAFVPRIGYPDRWRDYASLDVKPGDAFGNKLRASHWRHDYGVNKLGKPIYRWEWGMTPTQVNASASPTLVAITFPAAILQPPFFDPKADPAINYGGIGAVIGHEISHHFDDQGSKYNEKGQLDDWWTPEDVAKFKARTAQLVAQYDAYEPLPGMRVKGALTLGENTADLAGLSAAYDAYKASLGGKPAPVIDGFTGDQRFYLGWAQVWRRNYREAALRNRLLTDPHAPSEQRVSVVRNLDPWYAAFKPAEGKGIALPPGERVRIW